MPKSSVKDTRKIKYSNEQLKELCLLWEKYISDSEMPHLSEFVSQPEIRHKFKLSHQYVSDHPELFDYYTSGMLAKSEAALVKKGLRGLAMPMVIFMLKQKQYGGYTDRNELDLKSGGQPVVFQNRVPRPSDKRKATVKPPQS